jgi:hypothetical protein
MGIVPNKLKYITFQLNSEKNIVYREFFSTTSICIVTKGCET